MTATNIAIQRKRGILHAVADRALYAEDGTIGGFRKKIRVVDMWPGVILGRGNSAIIDWLGDIIVSRFFSFDDVVDGVETLFAEVIDLAPLPDKVELILAGISQRRGQPESYVLHSSAELPVGGREAIQAQRSLGKACIVPRRGVLTRLPDLVCGPIVTPETVVAAGYNGIDLNADPADVIVGLRLIVEMQRQDKIPGTGGVHYIGGAADLVTISAEGISEMVLAEWPEDEVGAKIEPRPIDWSRGLNQQMVALLGNIATTDQVVKAKEDALATAWIQSGVSVGKYKDAVLALTATQADYSRASLQAQMGVQTFDVQAQAAKELEANIKAGLVPLDQANSAMTAYINKWKALGEQAQVAGSRFPQLTQLALDAGNANKQFDIFATSGLNSVSDGLVSIMNGTASVGDAFKNMSQAVVTALEKMIIQMIVIEPIAAGLKAILGGGLFGSGAAFGGGGGGGISASAHGNVFGFAQGSAFTGSIVNSPTLFRFANGGKLGVMGEAGPEAVMPLTRTSSGDLGVRMTGGGAQHIRLEVVSRVDKDGNIRTFVENVSGAQIANAAPGIVNAASRKSLQHVPTIVSATNRAQQVRGMRAG